MNNAALDAYEHTDYLSEGYPEVLDEARPAFKQLFQRLRALPDDAPMAERLKPFEEALRAINEVEEDIETVERETILGAIYEIGSLVGLDPESQFAEAWRGDW